MKYRYRLGIRQCTLFVRTVGELLLAYTAARPLIEHPNYQN